MGAERDCNGTGRQFFLTHTVFKRGKRAFKTLKGYLGGHNAQMLSLVHDYCLAMFISRASFTFARSAMIISLASFTFAHSARAGFTYSMRQKKLSIP